MQRVITLFLLGASLIVLNGCGYKAGPVTNKLVQTVNVANFENATYEPRLEVLVANAVIKRFQTEGSVKLVGEGAADYLLRGVVVDIRRRPLRYVSSDVERVREYELTLIAKVTVVENKTNKRVVNAAIFEGSTHFFVNQDLQSAERQAMPLAAQELGRKIVDRVVEGWW